VDRGQGDTDLLLVLLAPLRGDDDLFEPRCSPGLTGAVALCGKPAGNPGGDGTRIAGGLNGVTGRVDASSWFFSLTRGESSDGLQQSPVDGDGLPADERPVSDAEILLRCRSPGGPGGAPEICVASFVRSRLHSCRRSVTAGHRRRRGTAAVHLSFRHE